MIRTSRAAPFPAAFFANRLRRRALGLPGTFSCTKALIWGALALVGCAGSNASYASTGRSVLGPSAASRSRGGQAEVLLEKRSVLDRDALIREVLAKNPGIEARRQAARAARARRSQAEALDDPMLSYSFAPLSIAAPGVRYGQVIRISQRLPWPGQLSSRGAAAEAMAEAAEREIEISELELALVASELFDEYYLVDRALEINEHHLHLLRELKRSAEVQYEVGRGGLQDPLQAEVELSRLEQEAIMLRAQRRLVVARLNVLLHREPHKPLPPPPRKLALALDELGTESENLQRAAVKKRAELDAAAAEVRAFEQEAVAAEREYYPDFTLMAEYNSMWDMPEHQFMVGIELPIPLQLGRRGGARDEASAQAARARSQAARLTDEIRSEVEIARLRARASRDIATQYERSLIPAARAQVDAARTAFTTGRAPFVAVIEAEKNLREMELGYHATLVELSKSFAQLQRSLGEVPGIKSHGGTR